MRHVPRAATLAFVLAVLGSGCGWAAGEPVPEDAPRISMVNATTTPVAVLVNGAWIGTYPAWSQQLGLPIHGQGGPPWKISFETPRGESMGAFMIDPRGGAPDTAIGYDGPCGLFQAWSGPRQDDVRKLDLNQPRPPADPACR